MPTDTDAVTVVDPDDIDSNCHGNPLDADGPTDVWCGDDAVTFVFDPSGHRVYLCERHARQMNRFGDDAFDVADDVDAPTGVVCKRCQKFTPRHRINFEGICQECQDDG